MLGCSSQEYAVCTYKIPNPFPFENTMKFKNRKDGIVFPVLGDPGLCVYLFVADSVSSGGCCSPFCISHRGEDIGS